MVLFIKHNMDDVLIEIIPFVLDNTLRFDQVLQCAELAV